MYFFLSPFFLQLLSCRDELFSTCTLGVIFKKFSFFFLFFSFLSACVFFAVVKLHAAASQSMTFSPNLLQSLSSHIFTPPNRLNTHTHTPPSNAICFLGVVCPCPPPRCASSRPRPIFKSSTRVPARIPAPPHPLRLLTHDWASQIPKPRELRRSAGSL